MTVQNAMPSAYTQLVTMAEWEEMFLAQGGFDCVNGKPGSTDLQPSLNTGARTIVMQPGFCIIRGQLWGVTSGTQATAIPAASGSNRIDKLVMRLQRTATTAATIVQPVVITGTPSATPAPPAILSNTTYQDIPIAQWQSNSDGTLVSLQDIRQFNSYPILLFTSGQRPAPAKPTIGIETNTDSLMIWNGTTWKYITPSFQLVTDITTTNQPLASDGTVRTLCTVSFTGDGITNAEIVARIPSVIRERPGQNSITVKGTVGSGANVVSNAGANPVTVFTAFGYCSAVAYVEIDGNVIDQIWMGIPQSVSDMTAMNGDTIHYKTSSVTGDTPSAGTHVVRLFAYVIEGGEGITVKGDPNYPIRLQVSPVFE